MAEASSDPDVRRQCCFESPHSCLFQSFYIFQDDPIDRIDLNLCIHLCTNLPMRHLWSRHSHIACLTRHPMRIQSPFFQILLRQLSVHDTCLILPSPQRSNLSSEKLNFHNLIRATVVVFQFKVLAKYCSLATLMEHDNCVIKGLRTWVFELIASCGNVNNPFLNLGSVENSSWSSYCLY